MADMLHALLRPTVAVASAIAQRALSVVLGRFRDPCGLLFGRKFASWRSPARPESGNGYSRFLGDARGNQIGMGRGKCRMIACAENGSRSHLLQ